MCAGPAAKFEFSVFSISFTLQWSFKMASFAGTGPQFGCSRSRPTSDSHPSVTKGVPTLTRSAEQCVEGTGYCPKMDRDRALVRYSHLP